MDVRGGAITWEWQLGLNTSQSQESIGQTVDNNGVLTFKVLKRLVGYATTRNPHPPVFRNLKNCQLEENGFWEVWHRGIL